MQIQIIAPCFYPSEGSAQLEFFLRSAVKHGLIVNHYGIGDLYKDWMDTHVTRCIRALYDGWATGDYVLFTDSSDVIFTQGMDEIKRRYRRLGEPPILVSQEEDGLNAGGWIGRRDVAIAILEYLSRDISSANPQVLWRKAVRDYKIRVVLDHGGVIFSVNPPVIAASNACLIHLPGGYSDPKAGRYNQMKQAWEESGH